MSIINWKSYKVFKGKLNDLDGQKKLLVNTINQYSFCVAEKNEDFKSALLKSDVLLPDGVGIVAAVLLECGIKIKKIAGADAHSHLLDACAKNNKSCFYLGSSPETLNKIKSRLNMEMPGLRAGFYSPPYADNFTEADNTKMLAAVNAFKPDVLFIGMTAPKQEIWASNFKDQLDARVICTIGAVFDFYAETVKRPNKVWRDMGLEWFVRFCKEPRRLWKRYIYYGPMFFISLVRSFYTPRLSNQLK